jgi:hypothetical protein
MCPFSTNISFGPISPCLGPFQYLLQDDLAHSDERHRWVIVTNQQTVPRGDLARKLFCIHHAHAKFHA